MLSVEFWLGTVIALYLVTITLDPFTIITQNQKKMKHIITIILCASALLSTFANSQAQDFKLDGMDAAPSFTLEDRRGMEISLEDYKGKVVLLSFWHSSSKWCKDEIPHYNKLVERFESYEDIVFVNISMDKEKGKWDETIEATQFQGVHLLNGDASVHKMYKIDSWPTFVLIGKEGQILGHDLPSPQEQLYLDFILNEARLGVCSAQSYRDAALLKAGDENALGKAKQWLDRHYKGRLEEAGIIEDKRLKLKR